ncbi:Lon protease [Mycolicibacterium chlorophenolicum]|uniref:endopeptidase La n=1 Tax=Mycolicibacterium chlorophenolicum TaxID=37916 RepID=A0A0J6W2E4_9MYCO|nr:Lon protease [Mycolicibacterium chlorophenolicum]
MGRRVTLRVNPPLTSTVNGVNRRIATLIVALVPIVVFGVLATTVSVPYVALGPGPTFNTLGDVDGKPVVEIEGTDVKPTSGHLNMTTVSQMDGLTLGQALIFWASGRDQLIPRELVYPPDKSRDEIDEANTKDFQQSEDSAEYAALAYLKYPTAITVQSIDEKGPSKGKLQAGDAIDAVNNKPVANLEQFGAFLETTKPGDTIVVDYRRKNSPAGTTQVTLGSRPDRPHGVLGVNVLDAPWAPFAIDFNLANIGGPSAGLMFSLAVVDKLTTGDLNGSKFVAGTGTITPDGEVGSIGGITHKIVSAKEAGASVFLVPADNCDEAKSADEKDIELLKVDTLEHAIDGLRTLSAGGEPPRC